MNPRWLTDRMKAALQHAEMKPMHVDRALQQTEMGQTDGYLSRVLRGERKKIEYERVVAWAEVIAQRCQELGKEPVRPEWLLAGKGKMLSSAPEPLEAAIAYLGDRIAPRAVREVRAFAGAHPEVARTAFGWGQVLVAAQRRLTEAGELDVEAVVRDQGEAV